MKEWLKKTKVWRKKWLEPSVLIQVVLASLLTWYAIETSCSRQIAQDQLKNSQNQFGFIIKQARLGSNPRMAAKVSKMDYPRGSTSRPQYNRFVLADTGFDTLSKGVTLTLDLTNENTVPLFTCRVMNPTSTLAAKIYVWVYNKQDSLFYQCVHGGEPLQGPKGIARISKEPPQNKESMIFTIKKAFGSIADSIAPHCEIKDTSYSILLYQDILGATYFSKRHFHLMNNEPINDDLAEEYSYWSQ